MTVGSERPVWVGTSWKMNKTLAEARAFVDQVAERAVPASVHPFFLPAHTALASVRDRLPDDSGYLLGAQNAHWAGEGAGTGEVSMRMVADAGATLVEVGHSERREQFGETDTTVGAKVRAALDHGLTPLVCVGEGRAVRESGDPCVFVADQLRRALAGVDPHRVGGVLVAYEPVWAIGSGGRPARPEEIAEVVAALADVLAELSTTGAGLGLLYGGGVSAENAVALLGVPCVDGLFVGRAGWNAPDFLELVRIAGQVAGSSPRDEVSVTQP